MEINNLYPQVLDNGFVKVPALSVSPLNITAFTKMYTPDGREYNPLRGKKPDCSNKQKGDISRKGKKALEKAVYWFLYSVDRRIVTSGKGKNKIGFLTLTLPSVQKHSDKHIKSKCLNQFITEIREKYQVKKYIWKAEKQENDNIHFHLLTDTFLPIKEIQVIWNRILNKYQYVYDYSLKMRSMSWEQYRDMRLKEKPRKDETLKARQQRIRKAYKKGCSENWMNPNSVDIETLRGVKNIAAYISKYMSKGHKGKKENMKIDGRIWYSSQAVSKYKNLLLDGIEDIMGEFVEMIKNTKEKHIYETEYSVTIGVPVDRLRWFGYKIIPEEFKEYCKSLFCEATQQILTPIKTVIQETKKEIKEIKNDKQLSFHL